jgi:hypothetical protein
MGNATFPRDLVSDQSYSEKHLDKIKYMISNPFISLHTTASVFLFRLAITFLMVLGYATPSFSQDQSEKLRFETQVLGLKIGDLNAEKYKTGDTTHYKATSKVKFWFFGNVDVEVTTHSKYVDGYFVKSYSSSRTNRGDFETFIHWDGKKYVVDAKSYKFENNKPVEGLVKWCSTRSFFDELQDGEKFISEVFGLTTTIENRGQHVHGTTINENENQYFYEMGKLQKVMLEHSVKNFQYKKVE